MLLKFLEFSKIIIYLNKELIKTSQFIFPLKKKSMYHIKYFYLQASNLGNKNVMKIYLVKKKIVSSSKTYLCQKNKKKK